MVIVLVLLGVSVITTNTSPTDSVMHHIPTVIGIFALALLDHRWRLSNLSHTLIFCFLLLHVLGAHFLYSHVPYDDVAQSLFGTSLTELFGWKRNHYDRLVHLSFGVFLYLPLLEFIRRALPRVAWWWPPAVTVMAISFIGHAYELIEWLVAIMMSPETAENYNGQQGDTWDAHKDTALALCGALFAAGLVALAERFTGRKIGAQRLAGP